MQHQKEDAIGIHTHHKSQKYNIVWKKLVIYKKKKNIQSNSICIKFRVLGKFKYIG